MSDETAVTTTAQTKKRFAGRAVTRSIFTALLGMSNWFVHRMRVPQGESPEPNERKIIDDSVALTEKHIEDRWAQNPPYHRGFHAKSNGVLQATFEVLPDLDDDLRQGVFAEPGRTYQTWIRYSNGAGLVQADSEMDTRGMAIKLMGVRGKKLGLPETDGVDADAETQDFVMMAGGPCFFVASAAEYVDFQRAKDSGDYYLNMKNPHRAHRFREFLTAFQNAGVSPRSSVDARYWSLAPYGLGEGAMKFSVWMEEGAEPPDFDPDDPDFLRKGLKAQLAQGPIRLVFAIQTRVEGKNMPVEDWTVPWLEKDSPYRPAARITIEPQDIDADERRAFGDSLSYSPWHCLPAHRPLGQLSKLRGVVYRHSNRMRHAHNQQRWGEPTSWDSGLPDPPPED